MQEIITGQQFTRWCIGGAIVTPVVAALAVSVLFRHRASAPLYPWVVLLGVSGPLNYAGWSAYNAITNRLGIDTIANVAVNALMFTVLGVIAGVCWRRLVAGRDAADSGPGNETG